MPIGTPLPINNSGVPTGTGTITTNVDAPIGSLIVVFWYDNTSAQTPPATLSDSAGNTYSKAVNPTPTASTFTVAIYYSSSTANDLPSGGTITSTGNAAMAAFKVSGANGGLDRTNTLVNSTGTTSLS